MDAMALLCTLHADGPATLRLLRESGCTSLETLRELGDERLAELLDVPPAAARRLLREAEALRGRLGDDLLEREEAPLEFAATRRAVAPEPAASEVARRGDERLGPRDRDLMQRVLSSWRERDAGDDVNDVSATTASPDVRPERKSAVVSERHEWLSRTALHAPLQPPSAELAHEADDADGGLTPGALDGLSDECCRRLAQAGVRDLESLRGADVLALARATGLAFTLVQRLRFLARRAAATARASSPIRPAATAALPVATTSGDRSRDPLATPRDERFSLAEGPPRSHHETLLSERDYELRPRPPAGRGTPRNERGSEVPGGPFA